MPAPPPRQWVVLLPIAMGADVAPELDTPPDTLNVGCSGAGGKLAAGGKLTVPFSYLVSTWFSPCASTSLRARAQRREEASQGRRDVCPPGAPASVLSALRAAHHFCSCDSWSGWSACFNSLSATDALPGPVVQCVSSSLMRERSVAA